MLESRQTSTPAQVTPSPEFFHHERKLDAASLSEPSLTLVRNDTNFGLLIASKSHLDDATSYLHLDDVSYLHIVGKRCSYSHFDSVAIFFQNDVWFAQDVATQAFFPFPSTRPYHIAVIAPSELQRIRQAEADGLSYPVFESAQRHFGHLPGFSTQFRILHSPHDYATEQDVIPEDRYVHDKLSRVLAEENGGTASEPPAGE